MISQEEIDRLNKILEIDQKIDWIKDSPKDLPMVLNKIVLKGRYIKQVIKCQVGHIIIHEKIK